MEEQFEKVHALGRGAQGSVILVRRKADSSLFVIKQIFMEEHKKEDRQQIMNEIKVRTSSAACLPAEGWQQASTKGGNRRPIHIRVWLCGSHYKRLSTAGLRVWAWLRA